MKLWRLLLQSPNTLPKLRMYSPNLNTPTFSKNVSSTPVQVIHGETAAWQCVHLTSQDASLLSLIPKILTRSSGNTTSTNMPTIFWNYFLINRAMLYFYFSQPYCPNTSAKLQFNTPYKLQHHWILLYRASIHIIDLCWNAQTIGHRCFNIWIFKQPTSFGYVGELNQ